MNRWLAQSDWLASSLRGASPIAFAEAQLVQAATMTTSCPHPSFPAHVHSNNASIEKTSQHYHLFLSSFQDQLTNPILQLPRHPSSQTQKSSLQTPSTPECGQENDPKKKAGKQDTIYLPSSCALPSHSLTRSQPQPRHRLRLP